MSVPTVAANGRIYVAFMNTDDLTTGRDTTRSCGVIRPRAPRSRARSRWRPVIDGFTDYPIAVGRQTYQDSVFRTWAAGNIAADPTNPAHLAVVWSDMRNSPCPRRTIRTRRSPTRT